VLIDSKCCTTNVSDNGIKDTKYCHTGKTEQRYMSHTTTWLRGTVVERWSLTGKLSLSCARPTADGWPLMWVNRPLLGSQPGQLSLSYFWGRQMSSRLQLYVCNLSQERRHLVNTYEVKAGIGVIAGKNVWSMAECLACTTKSECYLNTLTFTFTFVMHYVTP